jgi:hypothetical protein
MHSRRRLMEVRRRWWVIHGDGEISATGEPRRRRRDVWPAELIRVATFGLPN